MIVIVKGGTGGIGMETARVMAKRGAHVVIGARNMGAAENAKTEILRQNANARVTLLHLDLSSFKSIKAFVRDFHALHRPLNILMYFFSLFLSPFKCILTAIFSVWIVDFTLYYGKCCTSESNKVN